MSPRAIETLDAVIGRVLMVGPPPAVASAADSAPAERALSFSLIFSGVRCTVQYVLLPIILPIFGYVGNLPFGIIALIDLFALCSVLYSLRRFWQIRHPRRWEFLAFALVVVGAVSLFLWYDLRQLTQ
jgi:hypothetical protein